MFTFGQAKSTVLQIALLGTIACAGAALGSDRTDKGKTFFGLLPDDCEQSHCTVAIVGTGKSGALKADIDLHFPQDGRTAKVGDVVYVSPNHKGPNLTIKSIVDDQVLGHRLLQMHSSNILFFDYVEDAVDVCCDTGKYYGPNWDCNYNSCH